ncbi:MAG TPA: DinB family protein [Planctomycetota bacterium]|nr:DinB family protein [Planctomycetota bacterium]
MTIAQSILPEYDQEIAATRRVLERVPAEHVAWKPHERSWSLGELSLHVANLLSWMRITLESDELDLAPPGGPGFQRVAFESPAATLAHFERHAAEGRAALAAAGDSDLARPWSLKLGGKVKFTMPRSACVRMFVLNHLIHHRGQLTVYLRQCDVPLPSIYGPTADEPGP